ncbi:MAG: hypothetical protein ACNI25_08190 [Halarcobacter sp.]
MEHETIIDDYTTKMNTKKARDIVRKRASIVEHPFCKCEFHFTSWYNKKNFRLGSFFSKRKTKGKHTTAVQIALMRKMIIIAHSLYKNDIQYDKDFYKKSCGFQE